MFGIVPNWPWLPVNRRLPAEEEQQNFDRAIAFVLAREGGYVNHPSDPGGATNYGVTQRTYNHWRTRRKLKVADVRSITLPEVWSIYKEDYWQRCGADNMPWPLCLVAFDTAINMGSGRSKTFTRQAGGDVDLYLRLRLERYIERITKEHPPSKDFAKGWANRVRHLATAAGVTYSTPTMDADAALRRLGA